MAKTNPRPFTPQEEHGQSLLSAIAKERIRTETSLYYNLEICKASIVSIKTYFSDTRLTIYSMLEYKDRIEKCEELQAMIEFLIKNKTKEMVLGKHGEEKKNTL